MNRPEPRRLLVGLVAVVPPVLYILFVNHFATRLILW